jgi:Zn-dependent peptidase ImmA (M78 family)
MLFKKCMANIPKSQIIKNSSLSHIKNLAEFIALAYPGIITPLEKIIEDEEVEIFYDSYGDTFDGMTIYDSPSFYLHINTFRGNKVGTTRARFTIAHELGHYFLDSHRIGLMRGLLQPHLSRNNEESYSRIEREADYFASCLLMPETRFKSFVQGRKFNFQLLRDVSAHFHVSLTAAAIRFSAIGNHSIMIVFGQSIPFRHCL